MNSVSSQDVPPSTLEAGKGSALRLPARVGQPTGRPAPTQVVAPSSSALTVEDLRFHYTGGSEVLKGAHLNLEPGQVTGLLGANGSGKSTLLGAVTSAIEGHRFGTVEAAPWAVGPIGYATQDIALYPHLTVAENLTHAARLATRRWDVNVLVDRAIEDFALNDIRGRTARFLSGGQRRIAHLACSFVHEPTIRLLDEPTTALDFATRQLLVELVATWAEKGISTLVTAHYPEDIEDLCTTITLLVEGQTHHLGSLRDYLARQRRLGNVETITADGVITTIELEGDLTTLVGVCASARKAGMDDALEVHSIQVKPPALRDLLCRDPTLRAAVKDDQERTS